MVRSDMKPGRAARDGVILLVVISMLVLFSLVGIAFVVYAEGQANTARIWREGESIPRPDMDPEVLLAYFLGQLVYGTDNPHSALRGHSLAETMYGRPGNTVPFNGSGRLHTNPDPTLDDYYQVDYTNYGGGVRDPHQFGGRNAPYTYPDFNSMFLAAVRGSDGLVLVPSYYRLNPQAGGAPIMLRPNTGYHTGFPVMTDRSGDVKNLAGSLGYNNGPNDSIWIDLGFPVMTAPNGQKFKPLFAPLIQDLDNRVNLNVHGNWACFPWFQGWNANDLVSHEGWGAWEVNFRHVIGTANEARNIFRGNGPVPGRYNGTAGLWGNTLQLHTNYAFRGPFYSQTDFNSLHEWANYTGQGYPVPVGAGNPVVRVPGVAGWTGTFSFPWFHWQFHNAGAQNSDEMYSHPKLYNYFDPDWSYYTSSGKQQLRDKSFSAAHLEALLRYGDSGSPAMNSDLFQLCPQSLADAKTRRLVTTHSFDLMRPGIPPYIWTGANTPPPYALTAGYPQGQPIPAPNFNDTPQNTGEFGADWRSIAAGLGRTYLNRALPDYPGLNGNLRITDTAGFDRAETARRKLAQDLFTALRRVTGAGDPNDPTLPAPEKDALRWLAQLAANIVDFIDNDNYMTPFSWAAGEWVFGNELPWLVLNEAYAEIGNTEADLARATAQDSLKLRFWIELHNPMDGVGGGTALYTYGIHPTALRDAARARLQIPADGASPAYPAYHIAVSTGPIPNRPDNARGDPDPARTRLVVASYDPPDPGQNPPPTVDTKVVNPINACYSPQPSGAPNTFVQTNPQSGPDAGNNGYYLIGPAYTDTADDFPGTSATKPKPTLRVKDQDINGQKSSLVYTLANDTDLTQLPRHTLALRRLACPHLPPQPNPGQPRYNPYITVDSMTDVPTTDAVKVNRTGVRMMPDTVTDVTKRYSVGRNQPYAADATQVKDQKPATALTSQPQHTFFKINVQTVDPATGLEKTVNGNPVRFPFKWLRFADRPLVSPMELLVVSGYKPYEQTQKFMTGGTDPATGEPLNRYGHIAPWYDGSARIHRLFEFLEAGAPLQMCPMGGRAPGRINLNTVWDVETFRSLCDAQPANGFTAAEVDAIFDKMVRSRSRGPLNAPSANDRPFQLASGDIEDSLFRRDPDDNTRRLFDVNPGGQHPHLYTELLRKTANNVTTRSNVFGVWLTVGFFEVLDSGSSGGPPRLGREVGRAENRHVRHRMFSIVDRTTLTVDPATPLQFYVESLTPVTAVNQPTTIQLHVLNGRYESVPWSITRGSLLVIDVGDRQETVPVTSVDVANNRFTATFTKAHDLGFAVSNAVLGHPGPQPRFEPRCPRYANVVRHFNIIE